MAKISASGLKNLASGVKGKPYSQGPWGAAKYRSHQIIPSGPLKGKKRGPREGPGIWGDCSSSVAVLVNYVTGRDPWAGNRFSTHTMGSVLPGKGFVKGRGGANTLRVSWGSGHTVARLPDGTDFEMTPNYGLFGSVRNKVEKYPNAYYLPASKFDGKGGASSTPQVTKASGTVTITASSLNVRSGAGTGYRVVGSLKKGQKATVTGAQGSWLRISHGGGSAWIHKNYTKKSSPATTSSKPSSSSSSSRKATVTASAGLNVRSGAGTGYRVLGVLKKGQSVTVTSEKSGWLKIAYGSSGGWVSKKYTKAGASSTSTSKPAAPKTKKVTVTASALNVRSGAGTNYRVLGSLKKGQSATVTSEKGAWLKISYGSSGGWIAKKYTKAGASSGGSSQSTASKPRKVTITASALNVRSGAGTNYRVLGSLKKGRTATVTSEKSGWLKIAYGSSGGWIAKKYTKAGASSGGSSQAAAPKTKKASVTTNVLNVRSGASTNHRIVGKVKRGQSLTVSSESKGWLKIKAGSINGWVSKAYTSLGSSGSSSSSSAASGRAAKVLRVARSHIGSKRWPSLCQAFVSDVFIQAGINNVRRASAKAAENSFGGKKGNPPAGAAVYMSSSTTAGRKYGHVGIATGRGLTIVHSANGVRESSANSSWSRYTSWGWHGNTKLS